MKNKWFGAGLSVSSKGQRRLGVRKIHSGFALIEAVVSLVILSVGILAATRLHMAVITTHSEAVSRSQAVFFSQQVAESLRGAPSRADFVSRCANYANFMTGTSLPAGISSVSVVSPNCNLPLPVINISVAWVSPVNGTTQSVGYNGPLAWIDPLKYGASGGGGVGPGFIAPSQLAKRITDTVGTDQGEFSTSETRPGNFAVKTTDDGKFILYSKSGSKYFKKVESVRDFVMVSGVFAVHSSATSTVKVGGKTNNEKWNLSQVKMVTSEVGECASPLLYTDANNPFTYSVPTVTVANNSAAGYICYLPEGWYGNLAIAYSEDKDKDGPFSGKPFSSCPLISSSSTDGIRSHKVLITDILGEPVGQSGIIKARHEFVSGSPTRPLNRLDYIIHFENSCPSSVGSLVTSLGASGTSLSDACRSSVACLKPYDYILETVTATVEVSGDLVKSTPETDLTGLTLAADTACTSGCACVIEASKYRCGVRMGWSGSIVASAPLSLKTCSPNNSVTNVRANLNKNLTVYGNDVACPS